MKKRSFFWGLTGVSAAVLLGGAASLYQATETRLWIDRAAGLSISVPLAAPDDLTTGYSVAKDTSERFPLSFTRVTTDGDWLDEDKELAALTLCMLEVGPDSGDHIRRLMSAMKTEADGGAAVSRRLCDTLAYQTDSTTERVFHSAHTVETVTGTMVLCEVGFTDTSQRKLKRARHLYGLTTVGSTGYGLGCSMAAENEEAVIRWWAERRPELDRIYASLAYQPASR